jgi:hypothetical protein
MKRVLRQSAGVAAVVAAVDTGAGVVVMEAAGADAEATVVEAVGAEAGAEEIAATAETAGNRFLKSNFQPLRLFGVAWFTFKWMQGTFVP